MPYKFPNVSFDWLGELPQLSEEYRGREARKQTLANLDFSSPEAMEKSAAELFKSGNTQNMEIALRLQTAAREKRALGHRISEDQRYQRMLGPLLESFKSGGGGDAEVPDVPAPAPQQPDIPWGSGGAIPGVSQAPPAAPPAGPAGPGVPGNMAASPSEELLARAEGGPVAPQPGPRFAQVGGATPSPPPQATPPALPPWMQGAQAQPNTQRPAELPAGPPPLRQGSGTDQAVREAKQLEQQLQATALLGPKAPQGLLQSLLVRYRNALEKTSWTPERKNYEFEQTQRALQGQPRQPVAEWRAQNEVAGKSFDEVKERDKEFRKDGQTQRQVLTTIGRLDQIVSDPNFASGRTVMGFATAVSGMQALTKIATIMGVPVSEEWKTRVEQAATPALKATALAEEFTALSNKLVKDSLGTLGNQISEGDRGFVERMFPNLSLTPQGNKALLKYMRMVAEQAVRKEEWAREYRQKTPLHRQSAPDLDAYVAKKQDENALFEKSNGTVTKLGKEFEADAAKHAPQPQQPTQAPAAQPPRPAAPRAPQRTYGPADEGRTLNGGKLIIRNGEIVPNNPQQGD